MYLPEAYKVNLHKQACCADTYTYTYTFRQTHSDRHSRQTKTDTKIWTQTDRNRKKDANRHIIVNFRVIQPQTDCENLDCLQVWFERIELILSPAGGFGPPLIIIPKHPSPCRAVQGLPV